MNASAPQQRRTNTTLPLVIESPLRYLALPPDRIFSVVDRDRFGKLQTYTSDPRPDAAFPGTWSHTVWGGHAIRAAIAAGAWAWIDALPDGCYVAGWVDPARDVHGWRATGSPRDLAVALQTGLTSRETANAGFYDVLAAVHAFLGLVGYRPAPRWGVGR
jgi:hypothetical protein